ncbi:MAG: polysaccharide deacetylase family protein [Synechococcaceae cyanobacterium SM2_3_1]|nr:polysaccharide deacetylase family protein [Synechococcaceae cyanobacterium SM2_3_1]
MPQARSILPQPLYPWVRRGLQHLFPDCLWTLPDQEKGVALTFDDGPHPEYTPALLEVLDQFQIKATFFLLGERVQRWPEVVEQIAQAGHQLGIHGWHHRSFPQLTAVDLRQSLQRTQALLMQIGGQSQDHYQLVRPPNGLFLPQTLVHLRQWGYQPVMWSIVPEDWLQPPPQEVIRRIRAQLFPGALIVLHDGVHGGSQVAETVSDLLPSLLAQGFQFLPLASSPECFCR